MDRCAIVEERPRFHNDVVVLRSPSMSGPRSTVLVLGASGRLGQAATAAFAAAGWEVVAQRRPHPARPAAALAGAARVLEAEVTDPAALASRVGRADVVVHAMNPSSYTAPAWRAQAPRLMQAAIDTSRPLGALLMFPGNVYNFGAAMPAVLREDTPQRPTTVKGAVRVALERQLAEAAGTGVRSVVLRAGDFFGCGRGSLLDLLIAKGLQRGRVDLPGGLDVRTPFAYLPDLAEAFVRVADARAHLAEGAHVLHFAGHAVRGQDWVDALAPMAREAGWIGASQPLRVGGLPWPLLRAGGLLVPQWASLAEMRYLWRTPHALDNARLQDLIGPEPHTPFGPAVRQALADLALLPPAAQLQAA
jgi:nucleoside-diphosphate-sugar epimerase